MGSRPASGVEKKHDVPYEHTCRNREARFGSPWSSCGRFTLWQFECLALSLPKHGLTTVGPAVSAQAQQPVQQTSSVQIYPVMAHFYGSSQSFVLFHTRAVRRASHCSRETIMGSRKPRMYKPGAFTVAVIWNEPAEVRLALRRGQFQG